MSDFLSTKRESRDRMQTHHDKKQSQVMKKFAQGYAWKFGIDPQVMFAVMAIMGKEAGVVEYDAVIKLCVKDARTSNDVESALDHIEKAFEFLKEMKQCGFSIEFLKEMKFAVELQIMGKEVYQSYKVPTI
ncbi:Pentatricopeptide repeat-containing protein [Cardamine amara subsp. amara]|uniref:Pentatricopeptide repeat-containing protein n=1 Tax=Cardamine amara subsp. amara TaxID=228776 RepID=A0ABD1A4L2_CARAN